MASNIDFLCIINQERKRFGLRDSDYHKYRVHCTKKLKVLRKSTGLQHIDPKTKKFEKRTLEDTHQILLDYHQNHNTNRDHENYIKIFLIELFQVEHAWASSREIKEEIQSILKKPKNRSVDHSTNLTPQTNHHFHSSLAKLRHHSNQRLSKAIKHSDRLINLCNSSNSLSISSLAQAHVHKLYLKSLLDLELDRWDSALDHLSASSVILRSLANSIEQSAHKKRAMFYESIDDLTPMIRYCAYKSDLDLSRVDLQDLCHDKVDQIGGIAKVLNDDKNSVEIERFVQASKSIVHPTIDFKWLNDQLIPIRNPELIDIISSVQKADEILLNQLGLITPGTVSAHESDRPPIGLTKKQRRQKFLMDKNPKSNSSHRSKITNVGFDQALSIYLEAESSLKALVEASDRSIESNSTIQRFDQHSNTLSTIYSIVGFRLLSTRVKRDLELVKKLEARLIKKERHVEHRILKNLTNYQQIGRLIKKSNASVATTTTPNHLDTNIPDIDHRIRSIDRLDHVKLLLIKRRQAKIFPSLLKLIDGILFNLERIKQLKVIEEDNLLSLKLDSKVSLFKAYRSLIQSKSYLLIEKYLESYGLQQKSNFYFRQTKMRLEEIEEEEEESRIIEEKEEREMDEDQGRPIVDLSYEFFKFDQDERDRMKLIDDPVQDRLKLEIIQLWSSSASSSTNSLMNRKAEIERMDKIDRLMSSSSSKLERLSLNTTDRVTFDPSSDELKPQGSSHQPNFDSIHVFDLAYNYVTQFDSITLLPTHSENLPSSSKKTCLPSTATNDDLPTSAPTITASQDPAPQPKKSGIWSFFSRS